jgi:hypothetical protein
VAGGEEGEEQEAQFLAAAHCGGHFVFFGRGRTGDIVTEILHQRFEKALVSMTHG